MTWRRSQSPSPQKVGCLNAGIWPDWRVHEYPECGRRLGASFTIPVVPPTAGQDGLLVTETAWDNSRRTVAHEGIALLVVKLPASH